ncbi:ABC transporter ATP-binding protein [Aurantivibrio plasticivorans]
MQSSDKPILIAKNLRRTYHVNGDSLFQKNLVTAIADASFSLKAGETLAIVGESGCGKSTLARLLTLIEAPDAGSLVMDGIDATDNLDSDTTKTLRQTVQIVFQDPYGSLNPRHKIGSILGEPLRINTSFNSKQRREAVENMLEKVGLRREYYNRYPHMFSGGQRQRIAIARALMLNPKIVVLDEPVSALDVSVQAQVLNLLQELKQTLNLTFVFISHDLSVVRYIADKLMVMYLGRVVEIGDSEKTFNNPQHPYTQALLSARPIADPANRKSNKAKRIKLAGELPSPLAPPSGCAFHPRCPIATTRCRTETPQLIHHESNASDVACHAVQQKST